MFESAPLPQRRTTSYKSYGSCSKKSESRDTTIISAWRNLTGAKDIPAKSQYWTLCGPMYSAKASTPTLQANCELNHVLREGLIQPHQFHGVEFIPEIHDANVAAVRHQWSKDGPKLYEGEFRTVFASAHGKPNFQPAIVNLDTMSQPRLAARLLGHVLNTLNYVTGEKLVTLNAVIDMRHLDIHHTIDDLYKEARKYCRSGGWAISDEGWQYKGTGVSSTTMATLILFQDKESARRSAASKC